MQRGFEFPRRSISFLSYLALKQNEPETALEVISLAKNIGYIDVRCIKVVAFARLKRLEEIGVFFRESLLSDVDGRRKRCYFQDTVSRQ